tara:strand:- start:7 stop:426 length:420 start_codon:yes stop_codon:yes gene_type:complete
MIDDIELQELRKGMETQFRYKFYKDPKFPFLQSIGIKHVIQGFEHPHEEVGFLGMLHLWWVPDPTGTVLGIWESEWLDTPHEGLALAQTLDTNRIYDVHKLEEVAHNHAQKMAEKEVMKQIQAKIRQEEEEESKTVLWN